MKLGDRGDDVLAMQHTLVEEGFDLPQYGADGDLGPETLLALELYARDRGIPWTIPDAVVASLLPEVETLPPPPQGYGAKFIDLRLEQKDPPSVTGKHRLLHGNVVRRHVSQVTGITIHQAAVKFGSRTSDVLDWPNDPDRALAERALGVASHAMAFCDGFFVASNPLDWFVHHGNGLNSFELGLEIDGKYPGLARDRTVEHTPLTASIIEAARAALLFLVTEGRRAGMPIEFVHAHRQASGTRRADPGEELWRHVVLDFAVARLGLKVQNDRTWTHSRGDGRPIPREWDDASFELY